MFHTSLLMGTIVLCLSTRGRRSSTARDTTAAWGAAGHGSIASITARANLVASVVATFGIQVRGCGQS